ncbi:hypothetical protein VKI21_06760 [Cyanobacterium aponinum UTEX 3222]|uniref:hypothetical protein n=1 Tax=Cyanobacterium aponinum TaxID=379064 RepID=UPI00308B81E7|nr:hypothetical protein VKI21_06760 [Cyanobacterium aponinum UTEX 3222]
MITKYPREQHPYAYLTMPFAHRDRLLLKKGSIVEDARNGKLYKVLSLHESSNHDFASYYMKEVDLVDDSKPDYVCGGCY